MDVIEYNGQRVYTASNRNTTVSDLARASAVSMIIDDAYFFKLDGDRNTDRLPLFDRKEVENLNSGLMVQVNEGSVIASVPIAGLDNIVGFILDTGTLGQDLSTLKGREVTAYSAYPTLLGIGINK